MLKQIITDFGVVVGIPVLLVVAYYTVMGSEGSTLLLSPTPAPQLNLQGQNADTLGLRSRDLLSQLSTLHFDKSVFQDPMFWSLVDFDQPVATSSLGRDLPFTTPEEVVILLRRANQSEIATTTKSDSSKSLTKPSQTKKP